jgi:hypothetical protein
LPLSILGSKSVKGIKYLEDKGLEHKFCGVVNIPNAKNLYSLYYDFKAHTRFNVIDDGVISPFLSSVNICESAVYLTPLALVPS